MKLLPFLFAVSLGASGLTDAIAQDKTPSPSQEELDKAFEELLTGSVLSGFFTVTGSKDDRPPAREEYRIKKVTKKKNDYWMFEAEVKYGGREFSFPFPLKVLWAGDTPTITLTDMTFPGIGTYSARVMFYKNQYAGVWDAGDHGGQMFGEVRRDDSDAGDSAEDSGDKADGDGEGDKSPPPPPPMASTKTEANEEPADQKESGSQHWPSFRGPNASGIVEGHPAPAAWNVKEGDNIKWRTPIPGLCHSSPVVWDDVVYLTSAVKTDAEDDAELVVGLYGSVEPVDDEGMHSFMVYAIDKATGDILWEEIANEEVPAIKRHPKGSHAGSSPATDGKHVVAFFGSEGLYCYDTEGDLLWEKNFGILDSGWYVAPDMQWGYTASPIIYGNKVIIQVDVQEDSFIGAYDVETGEEIWKTAREEVPTWGTPTIDDRDGRSQVIVNGFKHIGGYDLETGEELWKVVGGGDIPVPTPVIAHDLVFITNAHGRYAPILAISLDAKGEFDMNASKSEHMVWSQLRRGNYMQTPIVYGDYLYTCADNGAFRCYDAKTGEKVYDERLGGGGTGFTASGIATDGKLYFTSEEGEIYVVKAGTDFEILSVNDMTEQCMATPAISEGILFFRTRSNLVAVSATTQ